MTKESTSASKPADAGKAQLSSFRYSKGYCVVTLSNGVTGVVGTTADFPFTAMLSLKGSGQEMQYKHVGKVGEYERYVLEWAL